jgi:hypothetical protein
MPGPDHEQAFLEALKGIGLEPNARPLPSLDADSMAVVEGASTDKPSTTQSAAAPPVHVTAENLWRHPDAHPIALDLLMLRHYGPAWLGWEADTWRLSIPDDFRTASVSELTIAKLQACKALHLVDAFWQRWEVFAACLLPFNSEFPDFATMPVPSLAQCLVATDVAARIRSDVEWSSEMKAYFQAVYQHDGIFLPLPPLDFLHLEAPEEIDRPALLARWPEVRSSGRAPGGETPLDEQLRRLLAATEYLEESRARLHSQLQLHVHH